MDNTFDRKISDKKMIKDRIKAMILAMICLIAFIALVSVAFYHYVTYVMSPEEIAELIDTSECHKIKVLDHIQINGKLIRLEADGIEEQCALEATGGIRFGARHLLDAGRSRN